MTNPHIRLARLKHEHIQMLALRNDCNRIDFTSAGGYPPDKYFVTFRCKGLIKRPTVKIPLSECIGTEHKIGIDLHVLYPNEPPKLTMITPIFHPNFHRGAVCIGAFRKEMWSPAVPLVELVLMLGNMISYRNYEPSDPLDKEAADWAEQNRHLLPLDRRGWISQIIQAQTKTADVVVLDIPPARDHERDDDADIRIF